ncbi:MAG: VWA domain-containing protein [Chloroflexota bacterium]
MPGFGLGLSVVRPWLLLLLLVIPILYLAWRAWPPPMARRRAGFSLVLRVLLVALLVFALAGVRVSTLPQKRAVVAVVDLSGSLRDTSQQEEQAVRALAATRGPTDLFGAVTFGHDAAVEIPVSDHPDFDTFATKPDPNYTDLSGALRLASGLIPEGYARQLVLVTDGLQNLGDAASTVAALRAEGVRVDVYPVGTPPRSEALVLAVEAPSELREGQTLAVNVRLRSTVESAGTLTLFADEREVTSRAVSLPAGTSAQAFEVPGLTSGLHPVRLELQTKPDTYADNNVGTAAIRVLGRPTVLVLEGAAGEGANVAAALATTGVKVERRQSAQAPADTTTLGRYDGIVIVDAAADSFPGGSLAAIAASVKQLGHGLVAIGGPTSYGPGGWQGTPLEDALPVRMDLPNRKDKPKVAVVLVMETMEDPRADQVVLGAAEAVIDKLGPDDQVGVTDGINGFIVPLQPVTDKKAIDAKLEGARGLGDPPDYGQFIAMAGDALAKADAPLKHIVVLGDGDANFQSQAAIRALVQGLKAKNITTSTVAVDVHGSQPNMAFMQDIANWGGGRFYQSNSPSQVPDLLLKEAQVSLRPWFEQTPFFPKVTAAGNLLDGVPLNAFPELGGYVVSTPKPASEVYFTSPKQDPVLAAWTYGAGRSVAWTSDSNGVWTEGLLKSPVSQTLFGHMLLWTLPSGTGDRLTVESAPSGDGFELTITGPQTSGSVLSVGVLTPGLESLSQSLVAVGPGRWQGHIAAGDVGTYLIHAVLSKGGAPVASSDAAVAVPYSPEYLAFGRDDGFLRTLTKEGSGAVLAAPALAWKQASLPVPINSEIFWFLLAVVALLWPLDIAVRRLTLAPRQLGGLVRTMLTLRRPEEIEIAAPEELVRLRNRVAGMRRRRSAEVAGVMTGGPEPGESKRPAEAPTAAESELTDAESLSARLLDVKRRRGSG